MRVYISADIEGVTGVTHWDESEKAKPDARDYLAQMTAEVKAACEGFLEAGATEIWVKDAHGTGRNLDLARLPRKVRILKGWSGHPLCMVEHLDEGFAGVAMVGYHSRADGGGNPLAHTMSSRLVHLRINGRSASEFLLYGYGAATLGVPVILLTGDEDICREVAEVSPGTRTVAVKKGIGDSTINLHPDVAVDEIRQAALEALRGDPAAGLLTLPARFELDLRFRRHMDAYKYGFYPGMEQIDDFHLRFEAEDYFDVLRMVLFLM